MKDIFPLLSLILVTMLVSPAACGRLKHFRLSEATASTLPEGVAISTFANYVDHFNLTSRITYNQRYWHSESYWDRTTGPMILYLHGEGPGYILSLNTAPFILAKRLKAKIFMLEHRFYGASQPCHDWSLPCLRLLTHDQALADIAHFIQDQNRKLPKAQQKWLVIGGSYAGALAGWFKVKYPHLVTVAYSSSGVVSAITDYHQYMDQVHTDISRYPKCLQTLTDLVAYANRVISSGSEKEKMILKSAMGAAMLPDLDFLSYFTDIYLGEVQYSAGKFACSAIENLGDIPDMLKRVQTYAQVGRSFHVEPTDYTFEEEKKTVINTEGSSRQWMYQVCTAFGYFQTGTTKNPLRSEILGVEYCRTVCKRIFGADIFPSDVYTNSIGGDVRTVPQMKKVAFINGGDDPWQWAGVRDESLSNGQLLVKISKCADCAHCRDLDGPSPNDPKELKETKEKVLDMVVKWMKE